MQKTITEYMGQKLKPQAHNTNKQMGEHMTAKGKYPGSCLPVPLLR
jgi:hypothetical protein